MKKLFFGFSILLVLGLMAFGAVAGVGNGLPSGPHYNLNIIGAKTNKDVGDSDGHTLFVRLEGTTKIIMTQDPNGEFKVVDRNGVDEGSKTPEAKFNIAPGYYNVFARALGTPNKYVEITSGGIFEDAASGETEIWLGYVRIDRLSGKPQTVNINELFYVTVTLCTAVDGSGNCTQKTTYKDTWVFDIPELLEYFWKYDNKGLKLLQVRFYPCTLCDCNVNPPACATDYCMWADGSPICSSKTIVSMAPPKLTRTLATTWADMKK